MGMARWLAGCKIRLLVALGDLGRNTALLFLLCCYLEIHILRTTRKRQQGSLIRIPHISEYTRAPHSSHVNFLHFHAFIVASFFFWFISSE